MLNVPAAPLQPRPSEDDRTLRQAILCFLALNERPGVWTFFRAVRDPDPWSHGRAPPDIVIEIGGRIAYVEVRRQGGGPLSPRRRAALAIARCRGATCFVVRSLPEMERALRSLGVRLTPRGRLTRARESLPTQERGNGDARAS